MSAHGSQKNALHRSINKAARVVTGGLKELGQSLTAFPEAMLGKAPEKAPGTAPGIDYYLEHGDRTLPFKITRIDYGENQLVQRVYDEAAEALHAEVPEGAEAVWLNIDGLNPVAVDAVCQHFGFHLLVSEDVLHTSQRPKIEFFADHLQIVARQLQLRENGSLKNEQVNFFLFENTLITFQEEPGDVFDPVRRRLERTGTRLRSDRVDYLLYALLDSIIDHLFPLLEGYGSVLETLEDEITHDPSPECQQKLFALKQDLFLLRRTLWPMREVVDRLYRDDSGLIRSSIKTFLRDVQDHIMQVIDVIESYREAASGLNDLYQTSVANKMNEVMKVLTIMASFFIPLTFIAGVYGMNFEHIPELGWYYSYYVFWGVCLTIAVALFLVFRRKGWIGNRSR